MSVKNILLWMLASIAAIFTCLFFAIFILNIDAGMTMRSLNVIIPGWLCVVAIIVWRSKKVEKKSTDTSMHSD